MKLPNDARKQLPQPKQEYVENPEKNPMKL